MPPLPSPGQVVRLDWNYASYDGRATNIFHLAYTGAGGLTPLEIASLSTEPIVNGTLASPYIGASPGFEFSEECILQDLDSDMGPSAGYNPDWTGTNTGTQQAASNAVLVSWEIERRYRGGHPRTYMMVGTASDMLADSVKDWQAAFLGNIQSGMNDWLAAFPFTLGLRTYTPVCVSYWETVGGVRTLRETPLVQQITACIVRSRVCSQRRRLGKVGG